MVESLGPANSARLYLTAAADGATQMTDLVVQGIRECNLSLVAYLR